MPKNIIEQLITIADVSNSVDGRFQQIHLPIASNNVRGIGKFNNRDFVVDTQGNVSFTQDLNSIANVARIEAAEALQIAQETANTVQGFDDRLTEVEESDTAQNERLDTIEGEISNLNPIIDDYVRKQDNPDTLVEQVIGEVTDTGAYKVTEVLKDIKIPDGQVTRENITIPVVNNKARLFQPEEYETLQDLESWKESLLGMSLNHNVDMSDRPWAPDITPPSTAKLFWDFTGPNDQAYFSSVGPITPVMQITCVDANNHHIGFLASMNAGATFTVDAYPINTRFGNQFHFYGMFANGDYNINALQAEGNTFVVGTWQTFTFTMNTQTSGFAIDYRGDFYIRSITIVDGGVTTIYAFHNISNQYLFRNAAGRLAQWALVNFDDSNNSVLSTVNRIQTATSANTPMLKIQPGNNGKGALFLTFAGPFAGGSTFQTTLDFDKSSFDGIMASNGYAQFGYNIQGRVYMNNYLGNSLPDIVISPQSMTTWNGPVNYSTVIPAGGCTNIIFRIDYFINPSQFVNLPIYLTNIGVQPISGDINGLVQDYLNDKWLGIGLYFPVPDQSTLSDLTLPLKFTFFTNTAQWILTAGPMNAAATNNQYDSLGNLVKPGIVGGIVGADAKKYYGIVETNGEFTVSGLDDLDLLANNNANAVTNLQTNKLDKPASPSNTNNDLVVGNNTARRRQKLRVVVDMAKVEPSIPSIITTTKIVQGGYNPVDPTDNFAIPGQATGTPPTEVVDIDLSPAFGPVTQAMKKTLVCPDGGLLAESGSGRLITGSNIISGTIPAVYNQISPRTLNDSIFQVQPTSTGALLIPVFTHPAHLGPGLGEGFGPKAGVKLAQTTSNNWSGTVTVVVSVDQTAFNNWWGVRSGDPAGTRWSGQSQTTALQARAAGSILGDTIAQGMLAVQGTRWNGSGVPVGGLITYTINSNVAGSALFFDLVFGGFAPENIPALNARIVSVTGNADNVLNFSQSIQTIADQITNMQNSIPSYTTKSFVVTDADTQPPIVVNMAPNKISKITIQPIHGSVSYYKMRNASTSGWSNTDVTFNNTEPFYEQIIYLTGGNNGRTTYAVRSISRGAQANNPNNQPYDASNGKVWITGWQAQSSAYFEVQVVPIAASISLTFGGTNIYYMYTVLIEEWTN